MQTPVASGYKFGPFEVNPASGELLKDGRRIKIQDQPFRLLIALVENAGQVVTREEIQHRIWPDNRFVDFDSGLRVAVRKLRDALGDDADQPRFVETIPKRGYRLLIPAVLIRGVTDQVPAVAPSISKARSAAELATVPASHINKWTIAALVLLAVVAAAMLLFFVRGPRKLTGADTVVLADFANSTGDPVFDGTLRQGLAVQLEQSPFLNLISDQRIQQTLRLMGQPPEARLTPEIATDLCKRTQSAAVIHGSIASLGTQYVLGLKAVSCRTGDSLVEEQVEANRKEQVLSALDNAALKLREKLGESLSSIERFDTPLEQATTPSLDALQAYSLGRKTMVGQGEFPAAIPFFQRAIQLDPKFAMAFAALGSAYWNIGETESGAENVRKAYELRARVSEPEKFYIESTYYHYVTGDLEKARQVYDLSAQTFPRYSGTPLRLSQLYSEIGEYDKALAQIHEAIRLDSSRAVNFNDLVGNLIDLNRLQAARTAAQQAQSRQLDSTPLRSKLYRLSFLENDAVGMKQQLEWAAGKPGAEGMLELEAQAAAYFGHIQQSRDLSRRAVESVMLAQGKETAAGFEANQALRESLFGNMAEARRYANSALARSAGRDVQYAAALALIFAGDNRAGQTLAAGLAKRFPDDTILNFNYLPTIRAKLALSSNDPSKALSLLQSATPYELGDVWTGFLGAIYVRGEAYLAAHQATAAVVEFQKLIDHRGIVADNPIGALAHLQLGRAYVISGDTVKAKSEYKEFLQLWKDADADLPILKQAKAEYAKLQ